MSIDSISGVNGAQSAQRVNTVTAGVLSAIASAVSTTSTQDITQVTVASQLQLQSAGLKKVSANLLQATAQTQQASGAVEKIQNSLLQLQSISQGVVSGTLDASELAVASQSAGQLVAKIDHTVKNTTFDGKNPLDGSLSGDNSLSLDTLLGTNGSSGSSLSIPNLGSSGLFQGQPIDVSTPDTAETSLGIINPALSQVSSVISNIGTFQQTLNLASANVETAIVNQDAGQSTFSSADAENTSASLASLVQAGGAALSAQGSNLGAALSQIIG